MRKIIKAIRKEWYETIQFLPWKMLLICIVIAIVGVIGSSKIDAKEDDYINAVAVNRYYDPDNDITVMVYKGEDGKKYRVPDSMCVYYNDVKLKVVGGTVKEVIIYENH